MYKSVPRVKLYHDTYTVHVFGAPRRTSKTKGSTDLRRVCPTDMSKSRYVYLFRTQNLPTKHTIVLKLLYYVQCTRRISKGISYVEGLN